MSKGTRPKGWHDDFASDRPEHARRQGYMVFKHRVLPDNREERDVATGGFASPTGPDTRQADEHGWLPTGAAPEHGARRLVWVDLRGMHVHDRSYSDIGCWDRRMHVWRHGHGGKLFDPQPTHWQHLPAPPESENG